MSSSNSSRPFQIPFPPAVDAASRELARNSSRYKFISRSRTSLPHAIALSLDVHHIDRQEVPDALEVLFSWLGDRRLSTDDRDYPPNKVAYYILKSIAEVETYGYLSTDDDLVSVIRKNWSNIMKWTQAIYNAIIEDDLAQEAIFGFPVLNIIDQFGAIFFAIAQNERLARQLLPKPDVVQFLAQLSFAHDPRNMATKRPSASECLTRCIHVAMLMQTDARPLLDAVVRAGNGRASFAADRVLHHLQLATRTGTTIDRECLLVYFIETGYLFLTVDHPLWRALYRSRAVALMTRAAVILSQRQITPNTILGAAIEQYFCMYDQTGSKATVMQLLREGLRNGVLQVYANGFASLASCEESLRASMKKLLDRHLSASLAFHSVLRATLSAFSKISPAKSLELNKSCFGPEWIAFMRLLLARLILKHRFDLMNVNSPVPCDNCGEIDKGREFKKCARCKGRIYCSRACQKKAWRLGHRHQCEKKSMPDLTATDGRFLAMLAESDVWRHLPGLRELCQKRYPGVPFEQIGFRVDYTGHPVALDVFKVIDLIAEPEVADATRRVGIAVLRSGDDSSKRQTFFQINYPVGTKYRYSKVFCAGILGRFSIDGPVMQADAALKGTTRPSGRGPGGKPLKCCYDEVDEIIYRLEREEAAAVQMSLPAKHLWERLDG